MYFESHAHYDDKMYDDDRASVIYNVFDIGVKYIINISTDMRNIKRSIELANEYENIYATIGVHPHNVEYLQDTDMGKLEDYYKNNKKIVAIGEIGLDYYYDYSPRDLQVKWFKKQLDIAEKLCLPVVLHVREADKQAFDIVKESNIKRGVVHCFSGSSELAKEYIKLGFYIGIGGALTFKNAVKIVKVVNDISLDNILIETDSPYLSPVPNRGNRNTSINLSYIVNKIAEIKNVTHEEVCETTFNNGLELFSI